MTATGSRRNALPFNRSPLYVYSAGFAARLPARPATTPAVLAAAHPGNRMTLQQRWRALQFRIKDTQMAILHSPPLAALAAALAALRAKLQPLYAFAAACQARLDQLNEDYNQFLAEETKRRWTWSKRNAKELVFWQAVPPYIFCTSHV
jgi:hypothetical protein